MSLNVDPCDVPVLLLYNQESSWSLQEKEAIDAISNQLGDAIAGMGHPVTMLPLYNDKLREVLRSFDPQSHIVLNWCESIPGIPKSESMVARILEANAFTFTGADAVSLERAQDKHVMKNTLKAAGIPTPAWLVCDNTKNIAWNQFPAIVKAANEHCSEGLTRESVVMDKLELQTRVAYVLDKFRQPALIEEFIDGRELHVSLWGNDAIEMLPPAEMDFSQFKEVQDRLCTYASKFLPGSTHYEGIQTLLPAPLDSGEMHRLDDVCRVAYRVIGCRDYGRIDIRIRDGIFYVLDVNPNPDISADTSLVYAAEASGYSYGEAGSRIVLMAAARHPEWRAASSA